MTNTEKAFKALEDLMTIPASFGKAVREARVNDTLAVVAMCTEYLASIRDFVEEKRDNVSETRPDSDLYQSLSDEYDALEVLVTDLEEVDLTFGCF